LTPAGKKPCGVELDVITVLLRTYLQPKKEMKKKKTHQATQVAQAATYNNPVSIMKLSEVCDFAQQQLDNGLTESEAIQATAEFIKRIN